MKIYLDAGHGNGSEIYCNCRETGASEAKLRDDISPYVGHRSQ